MSHEDIASAWSVLCGRQDIDHILKELIGSHCLNISRARRDSSRLREVILSHLLTLRIIFDLQRSYLQSLEQSKESRSSTLAPEALFSGILHLLDVVAAACTSCPGLSVEISFSRLTAQTTLSGLRALLLLRKALATWEHDLLWSRFEEVYERGHWQESNQTFIISLCRQVIELLAKPIQDRRYNAPACAAASLPEFFTGLYIFQGKSRSIVDASLNVQGVSIQSATWVHDCLVLYDLWWSTTAALIQLCVVRKGRLEAKTKWSAVDKARELSEFRLVLATRLQIEQHTFRGQDTRTDAGWISEQLTTMLCQDLYSPCAHIQCKCFESESAVVQDLYFQYSMQHLITGFMSGDSSMTLFASEVSKALQNLQSALEKRSIAVTKPHLGFMIANPSSSLPMALQAGHAEALLFKRSTTISGSEISRKVLPAQQHQPSLPDSVSSPAINRPYAIIGDQLQASRVSEASTEITNAVVTLPQRQLSHTSSHTNNSHPETNTASDIFSHRSLPLSSVGESPRPQFRNPDSENLPEVHQYITEEPPQHRSFPNPDNFENFPEVYTPIMMKPSPDPQQAQPWQPDRESHLEVATSRSLTLPGAPSIISEDSGGNRSLFRADTSNSKPRKWQGLFGSGRTMAASSTPSFAFFACGTSLLIWNEFGAGCYDLNYADSMQFRRINASSVCAAAGGMKKCVVVVKDVSGYRIEVYEGPCDVPVREWKVGSLPYAIALSPNDSFVAAKFSRNVHIFQISDGNSFCHDLPQQNSRSGRGNHLVTFSTDSLSFVATTRYEPEKVINYWSDNTNNAKATFVESTAPTGYPGDDGLSALVCSSTATRAAFLTTFTEKGYPVFFSLASSKLASRPLRDPKGRIGSRLHRAVLCPTGTNLVLLTQRNDVYWLEDCWTSNQEPRKVGSIKRPVSVVKDVGMGMPNNDEIHVFWIEKGKGMLVTMGKGGGKTKPVELVVNLEMLIA